MIIFQHSGVHISVLRLHNFHSANESSVCTSIDNLWSQTKYPAVRKAYSLSDLAVIKISMNSPLSGKNCEIGNPILAP